MIATEPHPLIPIYCQAPAFNMTGKFGRSTVILIGMKELPDLVMREMESARLLEVTALPKALDGLRKSRLTLNDLLAVARCPPSHLRLMEALKQVMKLYAIDESNTLTCAKTLFI